MMPARSQDAWGQFPHLRGSLELANDLAHQERKPRQANAEVYDFNQQTMKALKTLAFLYSSFEKTAKTSGEVDELFDKDFVMLQEAMIRAKDAHRFADIAQEQDYDRRDEYHRLSEEYAAADGYLNEGLVCIRELVRDTAAATHSLSCGNPGSVGKRFTP